MKKLSVIIPVYNVEKYVRECIESLFRQELNDDEFEVIIVDDGSTDHSMASIAHLAGQHSNITLMTQANQGQSVARNNGMAVATGEYVLFLDSDDVVADRSLRQLTDLALREKPDIVLNDYIECGDDDIAAMRGHNPVQQLEYSETAGQNLLLPELCVFAWRSLYRRDFLLRNGITFYPGIFYEDLIYVNEAFIKAGRCLRTSWKLILYRLGQCSTASSYNLRKARYRCVAVGEIWKLAKLEQLDRRTRCKQKDVVFVYFYQFMSSISYCHLSRKEMHEALDFMLQTAPDLSFDNGTRQRILTLIYRYCPHLFADILLLSTMTRKRLKKVFR